MTTHNATQLLERLTRLCVQVIHIQHELINLRWMVESDVTPQRKPRKRKRGR